MNLLDKANIITTPTAYSEGKLHSVKPSVVLGNELVTNGDFATDSDWTKQTGWSISNGVANYDFTSDVKYIRQTLLNGGFVSGKTYRINFEITTGTAYMYINSNGGGLISLNTYSVGSYSLYTTASVNGSDLLIYGRNTGGTAFSIDNVSVKEYISADFDFTRGSTATRVNEAGLIESVAANLPRINYENGIGHLLLEGQRTNLIPYSESFSNAAWTKSGSTITSNAAISPDGTLNADKLVEDTSTGSHYAFISSVFTTSSINNTITLSVFAKKGGRDINLESYASGGGENPKVNFDLTNVTASLVAGTATFSIESFGADWYRCSITYTVSQSGSTVQAYIILLNGINVGYTGDGTSGVYIWGAQFEQGSYPTSYIVSNSGSATTRLAETCNNAGNSDIIPSGEGVLYAEIAALADDGARRRIYLSDNTSSNRVMISYDTGSNAFRCFVIAAGVQSFDIKVSVTSILDFHKIAIRFKENDFSLWIDGEQLATGTSGSEPTGLNDLSFDALGAFNFYGKTKMVAVFPYLSNDELECLTGEGYASFEALAAAYNYTTI